MNKIKITIPQPQWDSSLTSLIIDLEKLKTKRLESNLPFYIFMQIKDIFQKLETLGSARIEGNNTTLSEYIEKIIDNRLEDEREKEIINLEKAINFIESNIDEHPINRAFISELHKIVTDGLTPPPIGEGSKNPGMLRTFNVKINKSKHTPCDASVLNDYFEEFIKFINEKRKEQYELLSVAIAHHRFSYIHPFDNGNGRVGRLLNYALLIKLGFRVKSGRILNPSSVFYTDRNKYYKMLETADSLEDEDILKWCEYFLSGLKNELEKIDRLLNRDFVKDNILLPAIKYALDRKLITQKEQQALKLIVNNPDMTIKSQELSKIGIDTSIKKTRFMNKLKDKNIIVSTKENGRIYTINFKNSYLLRGVIDCLKKEHFISESLEG